MGADPAVLTRGLVKHYRAHEAVRGLDLTVAEGEIFGFLGPNGAGKTTSVGMLCTVLRPTAGLARVAGHDVCHAPDEVRRRIGVVFQDSTLDADLTALQNLQFHADLHGIPHRQGRNRAFAMLDLLGLAARRADRVRTFSGGMRRRLEIARGLLHSPHVLFLDEPTTGLDPQTRAAIWEHLHRLRDEQKVTVFLTTHQLEEAEQCDRLAIIDGGELVVEGTPAEIKAVAGADLVVLRTADDKAAARILRARFGLAVTVGTDGVRFRVTDAGSFVPRLCAEIVVPVYSVTMTPPTLENAFLEYTGHAIRDGLGNNSYGED
ncbi:ATP-binding cassette domain-containing protein [Micromonospora wenchangensis]|uniref:ATP-binding cassette domain-containing protein n=1 Tax=Micromonospora wenchangensis TaxID=1185415 RepID=UPI0037FBC11A